ncbi:polysaccharide biosynthesis tyrosine autokinase [Klebsiella sp. K794]|uniref:Polysaccharide biosynthesis tyrosine autokinase n=1 Tax=Citrobacter freundii TaxID=546 RepID=A0AAE7GQM9_CITFR|nr:polysaccharide biosynthesis tyrosine autokinase [Citrobacter freundii]QLO12767.1 polysaccharide biosynthesis tyrosine autokinase [Citrobacter freundii]
MAITTPPQQPNRNTAEVIDLGRLLGLLLDNKWLISGITAFFALAGVIYALCATPIYQVDALVQVEQKSAGVPGLSDVTEMLGSGDSEAATEIELIKSRMIIGQTVEELNLDVQIEPAFPYGVGKGLAARLGWQSGALLISRFQMPDAYKGLPFELELLANGAYRLSQDGNELLQGKAGELAQNPDGISLLVTDMKGEPGQRFTLTKLPTLQVINDLQQDLMVSEKGKKTGMLAMSLNGDDRDAIRSVLESVARNYVMKNIERNAAEAEKSLQFLQSHLPDVRSSLEASEQKLNSYRQKNESVDLNLEAKAALDTMVALETQLNQLTFKESDISQQFTKSHPAYISLMEKRNTLLKEKERINQQVQKLPKVQQDVLRLTRDVEVGQQIYLQLLNKVQELNILKAGTVGNVRIIDHAAVKIEPVKPKKPLIVVIATLLGGMLSVALVLIRAAFNRGVEGPDELEKLGINVYASVPLSEWEQEQSKKRQKGKKLTLLAQHNPADLSIEALRNLRTSLHFAMMEARNNVLMITGPSPSIGKSFITGNLASVIAQSGQRVLLIDADMRKGHLHHYFSASKSGLSDYLSGQKELQQIILSDEQQGFDFIARGQVPPNPSELLMHPRFSALLEWASQHYDLVLVDTPPLLAVTDAAIVGRLAGTVFLVARFAVTAAKEVEITQRRLEQNGIEVKGVILNAMERRAAGYYGGSYGYYQYSYQSAKN